MKQKERYESISYIGKIPKIMHTIWIQGYEEIPAENKKKYEQIKEMNSNWQFMFWDNEKIEEILKEYPSLSNIYNNSEKVNGMGNHFALKSDIARFVIMEKYGGLYFDMDFDCILDMDELFDNSNLPDKVEYNLVHKLLVTIRTEFYHQTKVNNVIK